MAGEQLPCQAKGKLGVRFSKLPVVPLLYLNPKWKTGGRFDLRGQDLPSEKKMKKKKKEKRTSGVSGLDIGRGAIHEGGDTGSGLKNGEGGRATQ